MGPGAILHWDGLGYSNAISTTVLYVRREFFVPTQLFAMLCCQPINLQLICPVSYLIFLQWWAARRLEGYISVWVGMCTTHNSKYYWTLESVSLLIHCHHKLMIIVCLLYYATCTLAGEEITIFLLVLICILLLQKFTSEWRIARRTWYHTLKDTFLGTEYIP